MQAAVIVVRKADRDLRSPGSSGRIKNLNKFSNFGRVQIICARSENN